MPSSLELVALLLQIAFDELDRRQEPENAHVSLCERATGCVGEGRYPIGQQPGACFGPARSHGAFEH